VSLVVLLLTRSRANMDRIAAAPELSKEACRYSHFVVDGSARAVLDTTAV
jgi:hypothetical protein